MIYQISAPPESNLHFPLEWSTLMPKGSRWLVAGEPKHPGLPYCMVPDDARASPHDPGRRWSVEWIGRQWRGGQSVSANQTVASQLTATEALLILMDRHTEPPAVPMSEFVSPERFPLHPGINPEAHLVPAAYLRGQAVEADDGPAMPTWLAQRLLYAPREFGPHWTEWAKCVIDADESASLICREPESSAVFSRPDDSTDRVYDLGAVLNPTLGDFMALDFVLANVPNAAPLIADPANLATQDKNQAMAFASASPAAVAALGRLGACLAQHPTPDPLGEAGETSTPAPRSPSLGG